MSKWRIRLLVWRARRARTVIVVPHFRRWLHQKYWEEGAVDDFLKPASPPPPLVCARCGHTRENHDFAASAIGRKLIDEDKSFVRWKAVCGKFGGAEGV